MRIESSVAMLVATSNLKMVEGVISAMRAADAASAAHGGPLGAGTTDNARNQIHPEPRYEPRRVIHPTPLYEPRIVFHPTARIETQELAYDRNGGPAVVVIEKAPSELPLQPPWKTAPWKNSPEAAPKIKLTRSHPDICHKGLLMDFFI
jgi:hypothetical protein